jgi:hypothetical protein
MFQGHPGRFLTISPGRTKRKKKLQHLCITEAIRPGFKEFIAQPGSMARAFFCQSSFFTPFALSLQYFLEKVVGYPGD